MKRGLILFTAACVGLLAMAAPGLGHNNSAPNLECTACHQGDLSSEVKLEGLPKNGFVPGTQYTLTVKVNYSEPPQGDVAGGFALQASGGKLTVKDKKNTQLSEDFITHTQEGSALRTWSFTWSAPKAKDEVTFTVMGLAANGDFSSVGDAVGADSFTVKPAK